MLLKIKDAFLAGGVFLDFHFKVLSTFISKIFFTVIKHPVFTLFCKLVFFTAIIFMVNTNAVPFYEKNLFFYDRIVHFCYFFYQSTFLYFSGFTAVYSDILKLKTLESLLSKRLEEVTDFTTNLSGTLGEVLKNVSELFSSTSSMKEDIAVLTKALVAARVELKVATKSLKALGVRFVEHQIKTEDQITALNKILEKVKNPIVGTFTAGLATGSKIVSNRPPR